MTGSAASGAQALLEALHATRGVVCLVGAGGKKTTMYALAAMHPGRVALSSTAHMYRYDPRRVDVIVNVDTDAPCPPCPDARVVAYAGPSTTAQRVGGLPPALLDEIRGHGAYALMVLKADGARGRWIKAPGDAEPLIPAFADTVIPVVAARVLGRRLADGIAHRPERLAAVAGLDMDTPIAPCHLARLLSSAAGALKGVGSARVVPLINMVDDDALQRLAREAAEGALAATDRFDSVVLASMRDRRLVARITR